MVEAHAGSGRHQCVDSAGASAHAEALRRAVNADRDVLATKADIADLKADMLKVTIGVAIGVEEALGVVEGLELGRCGVITSRSR